ncbi:probable cytochrome P450 313a4 [Teleopsis dalmanni]|uniref:probable cytochrome P450 313a4 n=1 Tax=Teleopsis dalmanni TaxID=139649 RepID=UPI0018CFB54A|nr:probable cytochrome P450 313a4 [Teleopsis dalmanni]
MESLKTYEVLKSVLVVLVVIVLLHWIWTRRKIYRFGLKFPIEFGFPIIGSLHKIRTVNSAVSGLGQIMKDCKSHTVCCWIGLFPVILTADPDIASSILRSKDLLNKAKTMYYPVYLTFKGGLVASPATEWVHNRKMIDASFTNKVLESFFPIFNKAKDDLIERYSVLVDKKEHKILKSLQTLSLGITVETTMGKVMYRGEQVSKGLAPIYTFLMNIISAEILMSSLKLGFILELYPKFRKRREQIYQFVNELIQAKLKRDINTINKSSNTETSDLNNIASNSAIPSIRKEPKIFIDQAIKLYQNQQFTWNDIISESITIVSAAFETTATAVYTTLVMLAMHPEAQQRLFEEILDVFPEKDFYVNSDQLSQLQYLDFVINESLRLVPSVPVIGRHVIKDTQIGEHVVPKDIQIIISIFHLHRRTDIWGPNAEKFDPERFSVEDFGEKQKNAYIPFSKGVRNCIGWRYALFAIKVLLCGLIRNYKFETDFKFEDLKYTSNVSLKYILEPELRLSRRSEDIIK